MVASENFRCLATTNDLWLVAQSTVLRLDRQTGARKDLALPDNILEIVTSADSLLLISHKSAGTNQLTRVSLADEFPHKPRMRPAPPAARPARAWQPPAARSTRQPGSARHHRPTARPRHRPNPGRTPCPSQTRRAAPTVAATVSRRWPQRRPVHRAIARIQNRRT